MVQIAKFKLWNNHKNSPTLRFYSFEINEKPSIQIKWSVYVLYLHIIFNEANYSGALVMAFKHIANSNAVQILLKKKKRTQIREYLEG